MTLTVLVALATLLPAQDPVVRPAPQPAVVDGLVRILWVRGTLDRDAAFYAGVERLGFDAVNVSSGADAAIPRRHGFGFYLDQPAGKGVLELRDAEWDRLRDAYERSRERESLVRPACLSARDVLWQLREKTRQRVLGAGADGMLAVALGDEVSVTRHANPLDFCMGPDCVAAFRDFLRRRHRDVDRLNGAWGTSFASFDEVVPLTTDQLRRRELGEAMLPANLRPWSEHREFMDSRLAGVVAELVADVERVAPGVPCGLTGIQPPSAFGGHDYRRLLPHLTLFEAYDIGGAADLARSLAPRGARELQTLFPPAEGDDPRLVQARLADAIAHGVWAVVAWSSVEVLGDDGKPSPYGRRLREAFGKLSGPAEAFAGAQIQRDPVWIVESQASVRAWWMLDSAGDGMTWVRRLSSYEATHSTSLAARASWVRLCEDLGVQPLLVTELDLADRLRDDPPAILVLPACLALSDDAVRAVRLFAGRGGTVVADHSPALYDEHLVLRQAPALDAMFGLHGRSLRHDALLVRQGTVASASARLRTGAAAAEAGVRGDLDEPSGEHHVFLEREVGRGRALYFNLAVCEYAAVRLSRDRLATALDLRERMRHVLRGAGVLPPVDVRGEGLPTCLERIVLRARDGRRLLAVRVNAVSSPGLLGTLAADGEREVTLTFPQKLRLRVLSSGQELGPAKSFELRLDPFSGLFLELQAAR